MTAIPEPVAATVPRERADHFRPDVEGLRAIAVLLVLFYHAGIPGFPGGYVGVDVFFVISGFLITGLILRELDATGGVSLTGFYARRARRLLPAAGLALLVTLIASVLLLSAVRIPDVATDIASAAAYVSNLRFGVQANDYFAVDVAPSPVLHFWSLSVEEQFYLFWPTIMLLLVRLSGRFRAGRTGLLIGLAGLSAVSLVACIWLTGVDQPWAFFLLPTRAWELGLGALIAVGVGRLPALQPRVSAALVIVGIAAIAAANLLLDDASVFPGYVAMLPVAGAGLVILGGLGRETLPTRLLGRRPCTFLGGNSYSLYLWHWPMLLFAAVIHGSALPLPLSLAVALAAIPVATLTQRLVEQPFRVGRFIGSRPRVNLGQALASTLALAVLCAGASVVARSDVETRLAGLIPQFDDMKRHATGWCTDLAEVDDPAACVHGVADADTTVVLFGDSTAEQWCPALVRIAIDRGIRLISLARPGCPYAQVAFFSDRLNRVEAECDAWREHVVARIDEESPALVVVVNLAHNRLMVEGQDSGDRSAVLSTYRDGVDATLDRLAGHRVATILSTPVSPFDVPECIAEHTDDLDACALPAGAVRVQWNDVAREAAEAHGAAWTDPTPWLRCDANGCPAVIDPYIVYRDRVHLTEPFAASLAPRLEPLLDAALAAVSAAPADPANTVSPPPNPPPSPTDGEQARGRMPSGDDPRGRRPRTPAPPSAGRLRAAAPRGRAGTSREGTIA